MSELSPSEKYLHWKSLPRGSPEQIAYARENKEDLRLVKLAAWAQVAKQNDDPDAFSKFYYLVHGNELPEHAREWVEDIYESHEEGVGCLEWAWRGSWKSTTLSVTFLAYRIGKEPEKTHLVVSANDDSADKITSSIANIIQLNQAWKMVFSNVVPYPKRGWGAEGYWVRDENYTEEQWAEITSSVIDPSLLGGGYKSSKLIGKHPSGVLHIDDIHDEKNSTSHKERQHVVKVVSDTILPMAIKGEGKEEGKLITWLNVVGTPWNKDDAYHYLMNTGEFKFRSMPVMEKAGEGDHGAVYCDGRNRQGLLFSDIVGWWKLKWPERFGIKTIISERARSGFRGFARMFLLDLDTGNVTGLKYYTYPHEQINLTWPMYGGCDFATVLVKEIEDHPGRDLFSLAYGAIDPMNRLIVTDGVIEQCTQKQAEDHLKKPQGLFKNWQRTVIEGDGSGETFWVSLMLRNPGLRVLMEKTGGKAKRYRQEREMGPWLENATVLISDADTPYLNALRKALDEFPDGNNDIRDGLYWLCRAVPTSVLQIPKTEDELPKPVRKVPVANPLVAFGRR